MCRDSIHPAHYIHGKEIKALFEAVKGASQKEALLKAIENMGGELDGLIQTLKEEFESAVKKNIK